MIFIFIQFKYYNKRVDLDDIVKRDAINLILLCCFIGAVVLRNFLKIDRFAKKNN